MHRSKFLSGFVVVLTLGLAGGATASAERLAVLDIDGIGHQRLEDLKQEDGIRWWVELDQELLVAVEGDDLRVSSKASFDIEGPLFLVRTGHGHQLDDLAGTQRLTSGGGWAVVSAAGRGELEAHLLHEGHAGCARHPGVFPLRPNTVLARQAANDPPRLGTVFDPGLQDLVDEVDADRWFNDASTLAAFNRWTRGGEILQARDWLVDQFEAVAGLAVTTESFAVGADTGFNVIATLPGTSQPDDWLIIGAHYDSVSQNPSSAAPGAEDNASGCSGVLQLARILSRRSPAATLIFICYAGEEQGLFGSTDHASKLVNSGNNSKVQGVLIMDMIGFTADSDLDSLLEANSGSQSLIQLFADAGNAFSDLRIVTSLNPFGSDHVPYLNRGMRALLVIENDWDQYPGYHRTSDLPANLDRDMGGETLKMNVAAIAHLAGVNATSTTIFEDGFESGNLGAWTESAP
ncbi:MAG: M28 family peptidase [Acidobacteriota bacterium]